MSGVNREHAAIIERSRSSRRRHGKDKEQSKEGDRDKDRE